MKTYQILYAEDVPHYAIGEIKARGPKDARSPRPGMSTPTSSHSARSGLAQSRLVGASSTSLRKSPGKYIAEDVRLDNYTLEQATDQEITIRDHGKELFRGPRARLRASRWHRRQTFLRRRPARHIADRQPDRGNLLRCSLRACSLH